MRPNKFNLALAAGLIAFGVPAAGQDNAPNAPPRSASELTLDDLIPQDATEAPEDWAAKGAEPVETAEVLAPPMPEEVDEDDTVATVPQGQDPAEPTPSPFDLEAVLDTLAIPVPERLEPDPDRPDFADIAAPDLVDLPELTEVPISSELTLALPADPSAFSEQAQFIARFRALSAIVALGSVDDTVPQLAARARSDQALLSDILRNYGYYDGEVIRQLSGGRRGTGEWDANDVGQEADRDPRVRFDIFPSLRYAFGEIDLGALDTLADPDGSDLRAAFAIRPGDPLYADRIVERQAVLRLALGESGYPFASVGEPELLVDHARQQGDLTLLVDPRGKYVFGAVVSSDDKFLSGRHLARIARFDAGDVYSAGMQADLRRAILATGLVSSVTIAPYPSSEPQNDEPGEVALNVDFERAPLRTISGAVGYGTEDGFKLEAAWEHRNLFPPEGALRLRGIIGTREQLASVTFRRNNFGGRDRILTLDAYASDIETEAVDARTVAVRAAFERVSNLLFQKPFSWQVGGEVLYTDERNRVIGGIPRPRQSYQITELFGSATYDSSDDLLDPSQGFRLTGFVAPEVSRSLGSETFYLRARADASVYQSVGSTVLAARLAAASNIGAEPFEIAPSRRLYAGGGGSVRGYGFQAIGPMNDLGEATGGGSLVELGLEARIQTGLLDGAVEIVPFIDAGSVALGQTPDFRFIRYGAGVGVRYKTSFGPIRVDVGAPLNPGPFDAPVVVYVSLGQAF